MTGGTLHCFFKPASGKAGKPASRRQPSPSVAEGSSAAAGGPAALQTAHAAEALCAQGGGAVQFARKRKRPSNYASAPAAQDGQLPACRLHETEGQAQPTAADATAGPTAAKRGSAARPLTQLYLDVGQRHFHSYRCPTCGMLFARGIDADERLHATFHAAATQGPRYQGWQGEQLVAKDGSKGRVLLFSSGAAGRTRKPLQELCGFLEEQMGLPKGWLLRVPLTVLLYVSAAKRIQACVAAEAVKEAYHVLPSLPPSVQHNMRSCGSAAVAASSNGKAEVAGAAADAGREQGANVGGAEALAAVSAAHVATSGRSLLSVTLSSGSVAAAATVEQCASLAGAVDVEASEGFQTTKPLDFAAQQQQRLAQQQLPAEEEAAPAAAAGPDSGQAAGPAAAGSASAPLVLDRRQRVRAVCGVRLMWVSLDARRRGLATRLLDCCRCQFMPGYVLPRHEVAFSAPTDAGRAFIEAYTGTRRFLVYE